MPGKPVRIGPFTDGLNNVSLSGESKDTELVDMVNFEVGPDNLLWSRPPYEAVPSTSIDGTTVTTNWKVLGVYRTSTTEWYLMVIKPKAAGASEVQAILMGDFTQAPVVVKSIPTGNEVTAFVQMNADCYFCVSSISPISSFKWNKGGVATDVSAMKKGSCMIAYKSRLWIAGVDTAAQSSRLYFSAIGTSGPTPDIWNGADFADVAPGEGGFITALLALNDSIMIFKNDGTWRFSYPASPSKGQFTKLSGSVGAASSTSVLEFENYVYVYDQGKVYEIVNNNFTQLNRFVRFNNDLSGVDGNANGVDLSIVNRRILVRYFNTVYAYGIDTRAWSQWRSYIGTPGKLYELPSDSASTASSTYIAASAGITQNAGTNVIPAFTDSYRLQLSSKIGSSNSITNVGTTFTVTTATESTVYLNADAVVNSTDIRLSGGQKWKLSGTFTATGGVITAVVTYLLRNGTTSVTNTTISGAVAQTFTAPDTAISASIGIKHTAVNQSYSMTGVTFSRQAISAPVSLISIKDDYPTVPVAVEFIDCTIRTKSYDYQAASVVKRLFWWGADVKTNRYIGAQLIPASVKRPPTWGELRAYTHAQLHQGTWGNPLSYLQRSLTIVDGGDPANAETENGRIFIKLIKSLRFKQISFRLDLSTTGNATTGPCKIHTITSYVTPKEKVVDKFN